MTPQILIAIAQLCISTGSSNSTIFGVDYEENYRRQLKCQRDLITCAKSKAKGWASAELALAEALTQCILEKRQ